MHMASAKHGLRRLYPIWFATRLTTIRIFSSKPHRPRRTAGASEIWKALCFMGAPGGPGLPSTTSPGRGAVKQWRRRRRNPPQHHVTPGNRLIWRRRTAPLRRQNARDARFHSENPMILQARQGLSFSVRPHAASPLNKPLLLNAPGASIHSSSVLIFISD